MTKSKLITTGLIRAMLAALYVSLVALVMSHSEKIFHENADMLIGIAMLLLFVISATVMGFLILGKPLLMYLDGEKKAAIKLFYFTIAWLALIALLIFTYLAIF